MTEELFGHAQRAVSREWGIPLGRLSPRQTFVSRLQGSMDVSEYSQLHCDECSTSSYHYSAVLYLSQRASFTGGDFVFTDPPREAGGKRELTRVRPEQGQAVMFSSGWENYHFVDSLSSGVRSASSPSPPPSPSASESLLTMYSSHPPPSSFHGVLSREEEESALLRFTDAVHRQVCGADLFHHAGARGPRGGHATAV